MREQGLASARTCRQRLSLMKQQPGSGGDNITPMELWSILVAANGAFEQLNKRQKRRGWVFWSRIVLRNRLWYAR